MRNKPTSAGRRPTGIDEAQTRAHGEALDTALRESVATKADITRLEIDITSLDRKIELAVRDLTIRMGAIAMALFAALASIKFFGLRKQFARAHKHFDEIGRRLDEMVRLRLNPLAYLLLAGIHFRRRRRRLRPPPFTRRACAPKILSAAGVSPPTTATKIDPERKRLPKGSATTPM